MRKSKHTKEFKDSTVQVVMQSDELMIKIAEDLGVHIETLYARNRVYKKGNRVFHQRNSIKYAWMKEHTKGFNVSVMCKILKVNRSAYCHWVKAGCIVNKVEEKLNRSIQDIFIEYIEVYDTRRIKAVLLQEYEVIVSRRKIGKIMHALNLRVKMKRKFRVKTTDSNHNYSISPNRLQRDFTTNVADEAYVGDIIYIRTQQGWLYFALLNDLFFRQIVGWSMDDNMETPLVNNALQVALLNRHSLYGILQSMSQKVTVGIMQ